MNKIIQIIAASAAAICGFLFGEFDGLMYALIAFMVLDYISGVLVAIAQKELSSKVGFKGIAKKVIILYSRVVWQMARHLKKLRLIILNSQMRIYSRYVIICKRSYNARNF